MKKSPAPSEFDQEDDEFVFISKDENGDQNTPGNQKLTIPPPPTQSHADLSPPPCVVVDIPSPPSHSPVLRDKQRVSPRSKISPAKDPINAPLQVNIEVSDQPPPLTKSNPPSGWDKFLSGCGSIFFCCRKRHVSLEKKNDPELEFTGVKVETATKTI